jgi:dolichol-phosphate mannosyltransferase
MSVFISIIVPLYNDQEVIPALCKRLLPVARGISEDFEVLLIDDGSKDKTWFEVLNEIKKAPEIIGIKLARNFGQQNSIAAGLDQAKGELIVIMDSDLQDRPEDIPKLIDAMNREGKDMAIAKWISRKDSMRRQLFSRFFHFVSGKITKLKYEPGLGIFRVLRRNVLEQLLHIQENTGTIISLMYWSGFDYSVVELNRDARFAGKSGYSLKKMLRLTADRIFSYSLFPIKLASFIGLFVGLLSMGFGVFLVIRRILFDNIAAGWTSTLVILTFLFGLNFFFLGIIGEYLGRIYIESKGRPKYIISRKVKRENLNDNE